MPQVESFPGPRQYAEQVLAQSQNMLRRAVAIVSPENPDQDPLSVFPAPGQVRAEDEGLALSEEQQQQLRDNALELGFGKPESITLSEQDLLGASVIIEGGQPHKMLAEALVVTEDVYANPGSVLMAASEQRKIENTAEIASAKRLFGKVGRTEYDVARDVVALMPGFVDLTGGAISNFAYDIHNNFATSKEASGQFIVVGYVNRGRSPVSMLRVDREDYVDDTGSAKYRKQPATAALIKIVDAYLKDISDSSQPIALVTSGTYRPSRTVGIALAGLALERPIGLVTYGNDLLNEIKGTLDPAPITQLPGELHKTAQEVVKLQAALGL